ncbi:hypothetical protein CCB80_09875 [Armatimonadetes bacterium Uphvl-Ar1]|nr:hypothetical protein CCB80_09875 [Armatimonadetes bacterium Uphvl-Ar1]
MVALIFAWATMPENVTVLDMANGFSAVDIEGKRVSVTSVTRRVDGRFREWRPGKGWSELERQDRMFDNVHRGGATVALTIEDVDFSDYSPAYSLTDLGAFQGGDNFSVFLEPGFKDRDWTTLVYSRAKWRPVGVFWANGQKGGIAGKLKDTKLEMVSKYWTSGEFSRDWTQIVLGTDERCLEFSYLYDGLDRSLVDRRVVFVNRMGDKMRGREFQVGVGLEKRIQYRAFVDLKAIDFVEIQERPVLVARAKGLPLQ